MGDFKNLTAENLAAFQQNYISDDSDTIVWPTLEELIAHAETRNRDGSNVEYATDQEMQERYARFTSRSVLFPCDTKVVSVVIDVVTLFFGGREMLRHRTLQQLEEFFLHAGVPLRDVSRCLNVLHFGNEVPYFTKAMAILRVLKFVFKGGVSAIVWGVWGIIVKNLSWKDLVLYGVEIGSEWFAFFATDGAAGVAMIVQNLVRGSWLALDLTEMIQCIRDNGSVAPTPGNRIAKTDSFGLCVMAVDFPNPPPAGGFLTKSDPTHPDYYLYGNTLYIQTSTSNNRFLGIVGMGYGMGLPDSIIYNLQPVNNNVAAIADNVEVILSGKYGGTDPVGFLTARATQDYGITIKQCFANVTDPNNSDVYHFRVVKVNRVDNGEDDGIYHQDQIVLSLTGIAVRDDTYYLGIIYDPTYASGNRLGYYIGITTNPQVWTIFKTPFNP